jgi:hypothetical protein
MLMIWASQQENDPGPPPPYEPATRFNDNRNSQYVALIIDDI